VAGISVATTAVAEGAADVGQPKAATSTGTATEGETVDTASQVQATKVEQVYLELQQTTHQMRGRVEGMGE